MPLIHLKEVKKDRLVALFEIRESESELLDKLGTHLPDLDQLEAYSNGLKRKEWLAARLLLKELCHILGIEYAGTRKDSNGKPFLQGHSIQISLSHSFPYVTVICDPINDVGIDIEQPKEKLYKIAPRFLDERELALCSNDLLAVCQFWCAKETLYKIYSRKGLNFREQIHLYTNGTSPWEHIQGIIQNEHISQSYELIAETGPDYALTYNIS